MNVVAMTLKFNKQRMIERARRIIGSETPGLLRDRLAARPGTRRWGGRVDLNGTEKAAQLAFNGRGALFGRQQASSRPGATTRFDGFGIWTRATFSRADTDTGEMDVGQLFIGVDHRPADSFVFGLLGQIDWTDKTDTLDGTSFKGLGWMVGPYMAVRLNRNLILDARLAFGLSSNDVNPIAYYVDQFTTGRSLGRVQLMGDFMIGNARLSPFVQFVYFKETQHGYTDSLGNLIPKQTVALGHLRFGPEIRWRYDLGAGIAFSPYGSVSGVWEFEESDSLSGIGDVVSGESFRARIGGGFEFRGGRWSFKLGAFYDGLGSGDATAWGGTARLTIPLGHRASLGRRLAKADPPQTAYIPNTTRDNVDE